MKEKLLSLVASCLLTLSAQAQTDSTLFNATVYNKEYNVYLKFNFYKSNITVPGQEIFGEIPGFLGDKLDGRKWLITDASIEGNAANLSIINDYGSEDLTAQLVIEGNQYILKQLKGSTIKVARNRKWVKLPKTLVFLKK